MSDKKKDYLLKRIEETRKAFDCSTADAAIISLLEEISYKLYLLTKEKTGTKEK